MIFIFIFNLNKIKVHGANEMYSLGISLIENDNVISYRNYNNESNEYDTKEGVLVEQFGITKDFIPGKIYQEKLAAKNTGEIDQYIRVQIYKFWTNKDGEKLRNNPDLINMNITNDTRWIIDESASTAERTVLLYNEILKKDEVTPNFLESFYVDSSIRNKVHYTTRKEGENTIIMTERAFNGINLNIEVKVDAISVHNAQDQIWSAWGIKVETDSNGDISLIH